MRTGRTVSFLTTAAGAATLSAFAFLTAKTWAGMYLPWKGSLAIAGAVALGAPWLLNKALTRVYRRYDRSASEWASLFGMMVATHLAFLPATYFGLLGADGAIAVREAARVSAVETGFLDEVSEDTLEAFPLSEVDTGVIRVPNVGTKDRPRVITRLDSGVLKAAYLPPAGNMYTRSAADFLVGPSETEAGKVLLCQAPKNERQHTRVRVPFEGGVVTFEFRSGSHSMSLSAR